MTSEIVRSAVRHLWETLESLGIPRALMGGIALAAWGCPRATRDVDLLVVVDQAELDRMLQKLLSSGCRAKHSPPVIVVGDHRFVQCLYTPPGEFYDVQFDLLLAETELHQSAVQRRVSRQVLGLATPIDVLNCDDLLLFKLVAGRMIDRADAAMLLRENREAMDMNYLDSWLHQLNLKMDYDEIEQEAFPPR